MRNGRNLVLGAACGLALFMTAGQALAIDCQADFQQLTTRAGATTAALNHSAKANKGKLDPISACPRLRNLAAIQGEMIAYMVKNKDWCHISDTDVETAKAGRARTAGLAGQACGFAAKIAIAKKRAEQQQAQGGAVQGGPPAPPRLPAGPL